MMTIGEIPIPKPLNHTEKLRFNALRNVNFLPSLSLTCVFSIDLPGVVPQVLKRMDSTNTQANRQSNIAANKSVKEMMGNILEEAIRKITVNTKTEKIKMGRSIHLAKKRVQGFAATTPISWVLSVMGGVRYE